MTGDLRVEKDHGRVHIYDRFGGGHIELTVDEAEYVSERLDTIVGE